MISWSYKALIQLAAACHAPWLRSFPSLYILYQHTQFIRLDCVLWSLGKTYGTPVRTLAGRFVPSRAGNVGLITWKSLPIILNWSSFMQTQMCEKPDRVFLLANNSRMSNYNSLISSSLELTCVNSFFNNSYHPHSVL